MCWSVCTTLVESATPLAIELLDLRDRFLSKMVYQTYNGYVLSQFKKLQADIRNKGDVKWKHVMHLLRLLLAGVARSRKAMCPCTSAPIATACWRSARRNSVRGRA